MTPAAGTAKQDLSVSAPPQRLGRLCLVVHDDLELRLRLAGLVRRATSGLDADSLGSAGLEHMPNEQLRSYLAVMLILEFMQKGQGADPLSAVARVRARAPGVPIFVFARHGDERAAARAMKAGAVDYWPIHAVDVQELAAAIKPILEARPAAPSAPVLVAPTAVAQPPSTPGVTLPSAAPHSTATPSTATPSTATPSVATPSVATPSTATPSVATPPVARASVARPPVATPPTATPTAAAPAVATPAGETSAAAIPAVGAPTMAAPAAAPGVLSAALASMPSSGAPKLGSASLTPSRSGVIALNESGYPAVAGYRMLKKIAHSSSATVYLARNSDLAQLVALKLQPIQGSSVPEEDRRAFARECEILSSLNHRSIADVIDFGITADYLYLALEYFPCGSMRDRLKNPVSERDALNYARQIAGALQVVHGAGIVHRDLKPSNLMLTTDNRVVLIDFGSARAHLVGFELSRSDLMTGTPYYACPEQIDGRDPDQRGDLYSLGVILYEMLAGRLPFLGNNLTEIFEGHRSGPVPQLPGAQAMYQPLINRLLAKNPDDRYASARHFLEALSAMTGSSSPSTSGTHAAFGSTAGTGVHAAIAAAPSTQTAPTGKAN
jgi:DNA-binding NarL/FixJ family response regulator